MLSIFSFLRAEEITSVIELLSSIQTTEIRPSISAQSSAPHIYPEGGQADIYLSDHPLLWQIKFFAGETF